MPHYHLYFLPIQLPRLLFMYFARYRTPLELHSASCSVNQGSKSWLASSFDLKAYSALSLSDKFKRPPRLQKLQKNPTLWYLFLTPKLLA